MLCQDATQATVKILWPLVLIYTTPQGIHTNAVCVCYKFLFCAQELLED